MCNYVWSTVRSDRTESRVYLDYAKRFRVQTKTHSHKKRLVCVCLYVWVYVFGVCVCVFSSHMFALPQEFFMPFVDITAMEQ